MRWRPFLFLICLAVGACGEMAQGLSDVQVVHSKVSRAMPKETIGVNLNSGKYLTVTLVNSPLKALAADEKGNKVSEIARLAYDAFPRRDELESIGVVFMEQKRYFFFFNYSDGRDAYFMKASDFRPVKPAGEGNSP
jgi:hypothetical protein